MDLKEEIARLKADKARGINQSSGSRRKAKVDILDKYEVKRSARSVDHQSLSTGTQGGSLKLKAQSGSILDKKAQLYDLLSKDPSGGKLSVAEQQFIQSEDVMVDFEQKSRDQARENGSAFKQKKVQGIDEFGRVRMIEEDLIHQEVGLHVNIDADYKEYDDKCQKGFHMFPPTAVNAIDDAGKVVQIQGKKRKRRVDHLNQSGDYEQQQQQEVDVFDYVPVDLKDEIKGIMSQKQYEAQNEWQESLKVDSTIQNDCLGVNQHQGPGHYRFTKQKKVQQLLDLAKARQETEDKRAISQTRNQIRKAANQSTDGTSLDAHPDTSNDDQIDSEVEECLEKL
ncbi:hypothetical protein MIR68_011053 [Amoeboaphelidium protococcarum]|nr:hypothetical protein MIR68_011053 [Amoeboaphelidium protococcarum]